jgi:Holliday junction resolvase RusA-like endonuclease
MVGKHASMYTPAKTRKAEEDLRVVVQNQMRSTTTHTWFDKEPLLLICTFGLQIPKSTSKKQQRMMAAGEILPTKKPDLDNLVKLVKDALEGVIYGNDSQICNTRASKIYTDQPMTIITVERIFPGEERA